GTLSNGKIIIDLMNDVGYDCATIGNHEFDYGFEVLDDPRFRSEMVMSKLHGIDLLIDAHEHAKDAYEQKDKEGRMVPYTQAGTKLATIGKVLIHPDNTITSEFADEVPEPEGIDAKPVARGKKEYWVDTAINRKIAEYTSDYDDLLKRKIGEIGFDLPVRSEEEGSLAKRHETGLMNLFADALCVLSESDISMHNGGGIREGLTKGDILYSDCVNAFPYGNDILVMKMKGQLILDVLEFSAKKLPMGNNGLIHGMGLEYTVDLSVPTSVKEDANGTFISIDGPYRVKDVRILGEPLDPNKEYTAAMSAYLQEGGDGFSMMKDAELLQYTQKVESCIFAEYIEKTLGGVVPEKYNAL
ncbi:MAG: bifunctional metallophosphatase/5'-nucleotidase, partial [Solobacterium sp.]|nr:bifunctional metallophosphatase/5'-nucleotidase [Solobacterium sp.]